MKIILTALSLALSFAALAQDIIPTKDGNITIKPILHGTFVMEYNDLTIYVDPYGGADKFAGQKPADLILITDIHGDHHNQETLDGLDLSKATIVAPSEVAKKLPSGKYKAIEIIGNGENKTLLNLKISAIPMYNLPETADSRHPKGRGNGYILTLGEKQVYISGDTEDIPEMLALKNIDVAFICMNMPYTMSAEQAASAVAAFQPAIVYPFHYRGSDGLADTEKFKQLVNASAPEVEVRLRNWYPEN